MKKITLILVAAVAMFTSCQNDENEVAKKTVTTFDASFEQPIAGDKNVKTLLANDGISVNWESGDKVTVVYVKNDDESQIQQVEFTATPKSDATKATLSTTTAIPEGYKAKYAVYSPNGLSDVTATYAQVVFKDFYDSSDMYPTNSFPSGANPAWGTIEGKTITFQNLAAIIVVSISNPSNTTYVPGLAVSSDFKICGNCKINKNSDGIITYDTGTASSILYKRISLNGGKYYYAVIPGTYSIKMLKGSSLHKTSGELKFERNHIYYLPAFAW